MGANKLQQVWDRQKIEQLMYRHVSSLDRMDAELMKSTYWAEAIELCQMNSLIPKC